MKTWKLWEHRGWGNNIEALRGDATKGYTLSWITQTAPKIGDRLLTKDQISWKLVDVEYAGTNPGDLYFVKIIKEHKNL